MQLKRLGPPGSLAAAVFCWTDPPYGLGEFDSSLHPRHFAEVAKAETTMNLDEIFLPPAETTTEVFEARGAPGQEPLMPAKQSGGF